MFSSRNKRIANNLVTSLVILSTLTGPFSMAAGNTAPTNHTNMGDTNSTAILAFTPLETPAPLSSAYTPTITFLYYDVATLGEDETRNKQMGYSPEEGKVHHFFQDNEVAIIKSALKELAPQVSWQDLQWTRSIHRLGNVWGIAKNGYFYAAEKEANLLLLDLLQFAKRHKVPESEIADIMQKFIIATSRSAIEKLRPLNQVHRERLRVFFQKLATTWGDPTLVGEATDRGPGIVTSTIAAIGIIAFGVVITFAPAIYLTNLKILPDHLTVPGALGALVLASYTAYVLAALYSKKTTSTPVNGDIFSQAILSCADLLTSDGRP